MTVRERAYRDIGAILQSARTELGYTQRQLAQKLKRPHTVVAKIELGERRIDVLEFIELANALRIDPRDLLARILEAK
jgi:transcriptional regulator with XRE-family HTH domain